MHACMFSYILFYMNPWTIAHQILLSMGFFREEYGNGLPFLPPGDIPDVGIDLVFPALGGGFFFTTEPPLYINKIVIIKVIK